MSKPKTTSAPVTQATAATTVQRDAHHSRGGLYRVVDGKRELIARTAEAWDVPPKPAAPSSDTETPATPKD